MYEVFEKHTSLSLVMDPVDADAIWLFSYYVPYFLPRRWHFLDSLTHRLGLNPDQQRENKIIQKKFVISSVHHLYHPKEALYIDKVRQVNALSDVVHFFSEQNIATNQHYFTRPIIHLPYWLSVIDFTPQTPALKQAARQMFGIPQARIVLGSFQRDSESDGVMPKLEKGPDRFCDIVEQLDPTRYFVLLAGTRRDYVEKRLNSAGVAFKNVGFVPTEMMTTLYHTLDYYLVTSRVEGGPQATLETMATQIPIYTTQVGVSNLLDQRVVFDASEKIVEALSRPYPDVLDTHFETIKQYSPETVIPHYDAVFIQLWEAYQVGELAKVAEKLPSFP